MKKFSKSHQPSSALRSHLCHEIGVGQFAIPADSTPADIRDSCRNSTNATLYL